MAAMQLDAYFSRPDALTYKEVARRIAAPDAAQVRQWAHKYAGRKASPKYAAAIERELYPHVTCEEVRDDLPWSRIPDPEWPNPKGRPVVDPCAPVKKRPQRAGQKEKA